MNPPSSPPSVPAPPAGTESIWQLLGEAIRGTDRDFTDAPIGRAVFFLAVPMVLEMVMESLFAVVDVFWVSKLGSDAVATVGLTESVLALVYAVAMGMSFAATAMVARRVGEKDPDGAARTGVQAIVLGLLLSLPISLAGLLFAEDLLRIMGATPSVVETGAGYMRIMLAGNATIVLLFLINAIFRGAGDAAVAMRVLWLANGLNIVLAPIFIFGLGPIPALGVTGAAVGTTIGRGIGVLYQVAMLARSEGRLVVRRRHLGLEPGTIGTLLRVSGAGVLQTLISTASWIGLVRIVALFGSSAIAGYTVGMRIIIFALLPAVGMANAAATMVGQCLGAGKPERAERAVWIAAGYNVVFLGSIGVVFILAAHPIVSLFTTEPEMLRYGAECLRVVSCGFFFYAFGIVMEQAFNGAGDTWTPTCLNLFCFWLWEIPLAWVLSSSLGMGPWGVFLAITIAFSTLAVAGLLLFRRGRWKQVKV